MAGSGGKFGDSVIDAFDNNLVTYWNLDEASGSRIDGVLKTGNDLTDNNTVGSTTGINNNCADFVAANAEYLSITDAAQTGLDYEYNERFTYSFWIKTTAQNNPHILNKYAGAAPLGIECQLADTSNGELLFSLINSGSNFMRVQTTNTFLEDGSWHNIVITYDGSGRAGGIIIYIDGTSVPLAILSDNLNGNSIVNTAPFIVGSFRGTSGYWDDQIDEIAVWSTTLNRNAAHAIYNSGTGRFWTAYASSESSSGNSSSSTEAQNSSSSSSLNSSSSIPESSSFSSLNSSESSSSPAISSSSSSPSSDSSSTDSSSTDSSASSDSSSTDSSDSSASSDSSSTVSSASSASSDSSSTNSSSTASSLSSSSSVVLASSESSSSSPSSESSSTQSSASSSSSLSVDESSSSSLNSSSSSSGYTKPNDNLGHQLIKAKGEQMSLQKRYTSVQIGVTDTGQKLWSWATEKLLWGWKQPMSSNDREQYNRRELNITAKIFVAEDPEIEEGDRIQDASGNNYYIRGVVDQAGLANIWRLNVEEVK